MRVLVTGGAGFIGSCVVRTLLAAGHEPVVLDDLSTGNASNLLPDVAFERLDILDETLAATVARHAPEAVVHLAAQVDVAASIRDPERDRAVNVEGTREVARAAAACGARRMLSASSAAVYGEPEMVPLPETARKIPENPYGASKLAAESVLAEELRPRGVDFASLRFANIFGERQDWRGEGGVVAIFSATMAEGRAPAVYGTGAQTRDFVYVGDIASAILAALTCEGPLAGEGPDGPAYNLSKGEETSVDDLAAVIARFAGYAGELEHLPAREGDIERSALDPRKAQRTLSWRASTSLEEGLRRTVGWFAEQASR